ncbi:MAG: hypothetical protein JOZ89_00345 [Gammaproteobacteria bacterium]|nr:hypothetical protein [Gammaproteobacteria bacterium]
MPVHREVEGVAADCAAASCGWLRPRTLDTVLELNDLGLALLAEQGLARGPAACPLLRQVAELWRMLDQQARQRAASCPYLLLDAGFADPTRWRLSSPAQVGDAAPLAYAAFFTVPAAGEVARLVFTYAWHLARSEPAAARLLLGMPAASAALIGGYTLRQIQVLAERHPDWLRPRWPARVEVWSELLIAAASGQGPALERARLRGLTLLAGETFQAPVSSARADLHGQSPSR